MDPAAAVGRLADAGAIAQRLASTYPENRDWSVMVRPLSDWMLPPQPKLIILMMMGAVTLVLLSVFVPVAFMPGITGTLFRQFAVVVSTAMVISAINALTLSPALCSVLLTHGSPRRGVMARVMNAIDRARDGYVAVVRRLVASCTEGRTLGVLGEARVNVLQLNLALDRAGR